MALKNSTHIKDSPAYTTTHPKPIIILLTDYVADRFIKAYYLGLRGDLQNFTFRIYCYNEYAWDYFKENNTIPQNNLYRLNVTHLKDVPLDGGMPEDEDTPKPEETTQPVAKRIDKVCVWGVMKLSNFSENHWRTISYHRCWMCCITSGSVDCWHSSI